MESLKMSWFIKTVIALSLTLAQGCYLHEPCGSVEECNREDDDCDGLIDEEFTDEEGRYNQLDHCGSCGLRCSELLPNATDHSCDLLADGYGCVALGCLPGYHLVGRACVPDVEILCMPCVSDDDCTLFAPTGRCVEMGSSRRCTRACDVDGCPVGFTCDGVECHPDSGFCACTPEMDGVSFGCVLETVDSVCAGRRLCEGGELSLVCEPAFEEICNGEDDDCDGTWDEDFLDEVGRYVHTGHCGECNHPCAPPGPNMDAWCEVVSGLPTCMTDCAEGFVDLDEIEANGCECERSVGAWPPSRLGVDADCDGEIDDTDEFIFVASWGADTNPGTLVFPKRSIEAGMDEASRVNKTVLVTGGIFHERIEVVPGVEAYGGYNADFSDRDPVLYSTVVQPQDSRHGEPALTCSGVSTASVIGGMTITGSDAVTSGTGSTAVYLEECTDAVGLVDLTVLAGRGADGRPGADSSDNLSEWGMTSLMELNGDDGGSGRDGYETSSTNCTTDMIDGGGRGRNSCPGSGHTLDGGAGADSICVDAGCVYGVPCGNSGCTDFMVGDVCDMDAVMANAVPNPPGGDGSGPGAGMGGESTYNAPTNRGTCHFCDDNPTLLRVGDDGEQGTSGEDGFGGTGCADSVGQFDEASGTWSSNGGAGGGVGSDGGGGGGGSAGGGYDLIGGVIDDCNNDALGGSGGGGGSGGCGAPRASGGQGGGSSIGIVVVLSSGSSAGPSCSNVTVVAATSGAGGPGGIGAGGGAGGGGGQGGGTTFWCSRRGGRGGDGGVGGAGGGGGGGCGGNVSGFHVIDQGGAAGAYVDSLEATNSVETLPAGGRGGPGGFSPGNSGTAGFDGDAQAFRLITE